MSILDFLKGKGLTKPAVVGPDGQVTFYDSPIQQAQAAARETVAPTFNANTDSPIPMQTEQVVGRDMGSDPSRMGQAGPAQDPSAITAMGDDPNAPKASGFSQATPGADASMVTPKFSDVATDRYGNVTRTPSPGLTKLGLFAKILKGGVQGTVDAIQGGALDAPRNGESNFGKGMAAAQAMPLVREQRQQAAQRGQIENDMLQANTQPVNTPFGPMPLFRAQAMAAYNKTLADAAKDRYVTPRNGGVYDTSKGSFAPGTEPQDKMQNVSPQQVYADSVKDAINRGVTGPALLQDPKVAASLTALRASQKSEKPDGLDQQYLDAASTGDAKTMANIEKAWHAKATQVHVNAGGTTNVPEIMPNTAQFKVAQDLAYGKLTMPQFRSLTAYSRDSGTKMAIYQKASELNPGFNPAQFEMGYKLASNPKVQQQLASMDNVIQAMPDLLQASDEATRIRVPALNKIAQWGGTQIGMKRYTNFHTAQIAFADELSGALGFGSATDMSRQMGVNMTDPNMSPEQFSDAVRNVIAPFINRKRASLLGQMGVYGQQGVNPAASAPTTPEQVKPAAKPGAAPTPRKDGITFIPLN